MSDGNDSESSPDPSNRLEMYQNGMPLVHQSAAILVTPMYLPGGKRSLSGISARGFGLGVALGMASTWTAILLYIGTPFWRAPFFVATLAIFHYLEFDMTARYNPPDAKVSSFLLSSNGYAYNIAHSVALTETVVRCWLQSDPRLEGSIMPFELPLIFPTVPTAVPVALGLCLILLGQYSRSAAMATAGTSFNHLVQSTKKDDHVLITTGIYAFSRHPSYFGFFWWALGTQLVLGNYVCFAAYALILWKFFSARISKEEQFLLRFFGQAYADYRTKTPVLIPLIP